MRALLCARQLWRRAPARHGGYLWRRGQGPLKFLVPARIALSPLHRRTEDVGLCDARVARGPAAARRHQPQQARHAGKGGNVQRGSGGGEGGAGKDAVRGTRPLVRSDKERVCTCTRCHRATARSCCPRAHTPASRVRRHVRAEGGGQAEALRQGGNEGQVRSPAAFFPCPGRGGRWPHVERHGQGHGSGEHWGS
jgi:hypothetical protein